MIRQSTLSDIPVMQSIFVDGKMKMRASGNLKQWTGGYPSDQLLCDDIKRGVSYVVERDGIVVGTFVLAICEDPTYKNIYYGQWTDDLMPYGTIHRIASADGAHGVMDEVLEWAFGRIGNIRVDTHRDNSIMRHLLTKYGFSYCGIIYLLNGDERLAYQRVVSLETERILLRRWNEDDAQALYRYASDPDVGPRAGWPAHESVDESLRVIRDIFSSDTVWAIVLKDTGEPIGCMGYYRQSTSNIPIGPYDCEVGYWVAKPYWNMGICTEALKLMIDYCIDVQRFDSIWCDHFMGNPASGRVLEKCGFYDTGRLNRCSNLLGGDKEMVKVYKYGG